MKHRPLIALSFALALVVSPAIGCGGSDRADPASPAATDDRDRGQRFSKVPEIDEGEDDDDLEVEGLRGRLDPKDVEAGIAPHGGALQACYTGAIGKRRYLGGRVEFKFFLSKAGVLDQVQIISSDLGAWPIEKCMLEVSRAMTFKKPKGGPADFSLPLEFSGRGSFAWWEEEVAELEVAERREELATCADESGAADPQNVWVTLYVGTRGQVQSAGFANQSDVPIADAWADCAYQKVTSWSLSDPKGRIAKAGFRYNPE